MDPDGSLSEPVYFIFEANSLIMYTVVYQLHNQTFFFPANNTFVKDAGVFTGTPGGVPHQGVIMPTPARLRHLTVLLRVSTVVGTPPVYTLNLLKNGVPVNVFTLTGSGPANTTTRHSFTSLTGFDFAVGDDIAYRIFSNVTGTDTSLCLYLLVSSFLEPGIF